MILDKILQRIAGMVYHRWLKVDLDDFADTVAERLSRLERRTEQLRGHDVRLEKRATTLEKQVEQDREQRVRFADKMNDTDSMARYAYNKMKDNA